MKARVPNDIKSYIKELEEALLYAMLRMASVVEYHPNKSLQSAIKKAAAVLRKKDGIRAFSTGKGAAIVIDPAEDETST